MKRINRFDAAGDFELEFLLFEKVRDFFFDLFEGFFTLFVGFLNEIFQIFKTARIDVRKS